MVANLMVMNMMESELLSGCCTSIFGDLLTKFVQIIVVIKPFLHYLCNFKIAYTVCLLIELMTSLSLLPSLSFLICVCTPSR